MPAAQKRKKTADMPDSPPKRVTRARAKASDEPASKAKTVKVMTPSAKIAAKKEKPADAAKAMKKTRADDEQHTEAVREQALAQPVKTRTRVKKAEEKAEEPEMMAEAPRKSRGRQNKIAEAEETKTAGPKTRGRPKKAEEPSDSMLLVSCEAEKPEAAKPATRKRATNAKPAEAVKGPEKTTNARSAAPKKKVTFQDTAEKDKENVPLETGKPTAKATGLRAKPIRRPAANRATTRKKKVATAKSESPTQASEDEVKPLSPKKVVQVAKSSSIGSEDELFGSKTPIRALGQSPVKPPPSSVRPVEGSMSKLDRGVTAAPPSPTKPAAPSVLQSPARRPPPSPFKDAMKSSPRKVNLGEVTPKPVVLFPQSPLKSTMKDSPKRGIVPAPLAQPVLLSKTPMKASLLQSPARRPGGSTVKTSMFQSPTKTEVAKPSTSTMALTAQIGSPGKLHSPPQEAASSPFRAMRAHGKVRNIIEADCIKITEPFMAGWVHEKTPGPFDEDTQSQNDFGNQDVEKDAQQNEDQSVPRSPTPSNVKENPRTPVDQSFALENVIEDSNDEALNARSTSPPGPIPFAASAFYLASPAFRSTVDESESEDELASPEKTSLRTPLKKQDVSTLDFGASPANTSAASRRSSLRSASSRRSLGMTPLAVQMSTWLASSPEKKDLSDSTETVQPLLSPTNPAFQESPAKTSFFDDQMAVCEPSNDTLVDVEMPEAETDPVFIEISKKSSSFEEYGDENAVPVDSQLDDMQQVPQEQTATCTPAKVFYAQPREIHTVSKVPLRPAGEESPLKLPRKRSRSTAGPLAPGNVLRISSAPAVVVEPVVEAENRTPVKGQSRNKPTSPVKPRSSNDDSLIETPRTFRGEAASSVLRGVVAYVDVHTSEGEDASGIFLELLTQMGARCVKQWSWNPRASMTGPVDTENSPSESRLSNSKVGITHIVFKDGGKRTMEKVRESRGAVACVGVGWVLE